MRVTAEVVGETDWGSASQQGEAPRILEGGRLHGTTVDLVTMEVQIVDPATVVLVRTVEQ